MIWTQTLAILVDAYRGLRARKMFWIVLAISALVVVGFAAIGIDEGGLKILAWRVTSAVNTETMSTGDLYRLMFVSVGLNFWLAWLATILALLSTAGIFPSFVTTGSIDLVLSRPIGRFRLFLTQYASGLLFVALQVSLFCLMSFLVMGLRGGTWQPGLFLAVPLVVCFFSYLFSVCALLGLLTRSTLAALLLTLLFWFVLYGIHSTETGLLTFQTDREQRAARLDKRIQSLTEQTEQLEQQSSDQRSDATEAKLRKLAGQVESAREDRQEALETAAKLGTAQRIVFGVKTFLPKTSETVGLMERVLISTTDLPGIDDDSEGAYADGRSRGPIGPKAAKATAEKMRQRSVAWVLGTSLAFEAVMLLLGGLVFCRRDY